jgi:surface protein
MLHLCRYLVFTKKFMAFLVISTLCGTMLMAQRTDFITRWKTDNPGVSNSNQITIPFQNNIPLNYRVIWGDGTTSTNVTTTSVTHTYASPGTYTVSIVGLTSGGRGLNSFRFAGGGDRLKLLSIEQWGNNEWERFESSFSGCENLVINATDRPIFGFGTNCLAMFKNCKSLNHPVNSWDVSQVSLMEEMFAGCTAFNQPLSNWNVINVRSFSGMFEGCTAFNQSLAAWNPVLLGSSYRMFYGATSFNSPLWSNGGSGNVFMFSMFQNATSFNQPINFPTFSCQNMNSMFEGATAFNRSLSGFDIRNLVSAFSMLDNCNMSVANYEATLVSWAAQPAQSNVFLGAAGRQYCTVGANARNILKNSFNWNILDDATAATSFTLLSGAGSNIITACTGFEMPEILYDVKNFDAATPGATGLPPGVALQVVSNQIKIAGTPTTTGVFNYTITATGICGSAQATGTITVVPGGEIISAPANNVLNQNICPGTSIVPITWVTNAGVKSVRFVGLPAGVTGSFQNNTITISGTPASGGSFSMFAFYSDACREFSVSSNLLVRQAAAVQLTSAAGTDQQSRCGGIAITPVSFFSNTGQVQVSNLPFGLNANVFLGNVTISGSVAAAGVYNYTITAVSDCGNSTPYAASLTVQAAPIITIGPAVPFICAGGTTGALGGSATGAGLISAIWSDGNVGGTFTNNAGSNPELVTYTPPANFAGTVSLRLTAIGSSCNSISSKGLQVLPTGTATWLGITNNWAAPTNWSTGAVPGACTQVIIPAGVQNPLVQGTGNRVQSLTVQAGASVTLANGATLVVEK